MSTQKKYAVCCDIGGSHISCQLVALGTGLIKENSATCVAVSHTESKENILSHWSDAIQRCKNSLSNSEVFSGLSIAIPGPFDYENGIGLYDSSNQKFENLKDVDIKRGLANSLNISSNCIHFLNDADAFALGSFAFGSGKEALKMIALTLGTGFGACFIDQGKVITTGPTVPKDGCFWHLPFKDGIADDYFSTRWFVDRYNKVSEIQVIGVKEIATKARDGNILAQSIFDDFAHNLAEFLAQYLRVFKPEIVVLGGNISEASDLFIPRLTKNLAVQHLKMVFESSKLKEKAAILGAVTML